MARIQKRPVEVEIRRAEAGETVETREGTLTAEEDDLIITGVNGEVYPIGPRIMAQTYVPVDDEARDLYRDALPPGVVVEFDDAGGETRVAGIWIDAAERLDAEQREEAEAFVRSFMESSPHLDANGGEIPYL